MKNFVNYFYISKINFSLSINYIIDKFINLINFIIINLKKINFKIINILILFNIN